MANSNDKILCLVGPSGSGKTTVANILEKGGFVSVQSYTTRPPRYEGETGHTFISNEEFDNLKDIVAYNEYNGYRYCTTKEQISKANLYVVDIPGLKMLKEKCNTQRIIAIGLKISETVAHERMRSRGDSEEKILARITEDRMAFKEFEQYCDVVIDSTILSPMVIADLVADVYYRFPSMINIVQVSELKIGDRILLDDWYRVVNDDDVSCVVIAENTVSKKPFGTVNWKDSEMRSFLNQEYLYTNILEHIEYDFLLGIPTQSVYDKIGIMSPEKCKEYNQRVPEAFANDDSFILCDVVLPKVYLATKSNDVLEISELDSAQCSQCNAVKPLLILSKDAYVSAMER